MVETTSSMMVEKRQYLDVAAEDDAAADATDVDATSSGFSISFSPMPGTSTGTGKTIVKSATAGGVVDQAGSIRATQGQALSSIDLGALHESLQGSATISEAKFGECIKGLLPAAEAPSDDTIAALFKAFDADNSGEVDQAELIAGCQALCSGDDSTKLRLAFKCFDADGDGHLDASELKVLLKGTIEPAVSALHGAIEFAAFGADEDGLVEAINDEAGGGAKLSQENVAEGMTRVELKTKVGVATIVVPLTALSDEAAGTSGGSLSLDAFLTALVDGAMAKYDADSSGTIEADEFVAFAHENEFLKTWFGHLADANARKFDARTDV